MPMKMSGAPLLPIRPRDTSPLALIRHGNDVDLVAGLLREVPPARLVVLIELGFLLPVRQEAQLLRRAPARRHRQRHRRERRQRDHAPSTHAPPFIGGTFRRRREDGRSRRRGHEGILLSSKMSTKGAVSTPHAELRMYDLSPLGIATPCGRTGRPAWRRP